MTTYGAKWSRHPHYDKDPLPDVKPALLNSLDIQRYVEEGCLVERDGFDKGRLKASSYEMKFLGTLYYWEEAKSRTKKQCKTISDGDFVELARNSISYLWIEEPLRLPEYVAARFNLRIREVHKGILLGTGPLLDPGFGGRILIPLHNLTDNAYVLRGGDGIIWVEFTKVSPNSYWLREGQESTRPRGLVGFPTHKLTDDPNDYLNKAGASGGVRSAFKGALDKAESDAKAASKSAKRIQTGITIGGIVGLLTVVIGVGAVVLSAYNISGQVSDRVHQQGKRIQELATILEGLSAQSSAMVVGEGGRASKPSGPAMLEADSSEAETGTEGEEQTVDGIDEKPEPEELIRQQDSE